MEILLLETESIIRRDIYIQLKNLGFKVTLQPEKACYDCIIIGNTVFLSSLMAKNPNLIDKSSLLFAITSKSNFEEASRSLRKPAYFIEKPFTNDALAKILSYIVKKQR